MAASPPWIIAFGKPSLNTLSAMARDPKANAWRPTIWILLAGLIATILSIGADYLTHQVAYQRLTSNQLALQYGPLLLIGMFGSWAGFVILVAIQHLIARRLGGEGTFGQQAYVVGAIFAPLLVLTVVVASLPIINFLSPGLVAYGLALEVTAVKTVYSFGWIKALLSSVVIWLVIAAVLILVMFILLGPTIGNIFSNITAST